MSDLIYILGPGRNGSTVLERLICSDEKYFALGEFHCLWRMKPEELSCSCGRYIRECEFWRAVLEQAKVSFDDLAEMNLAEQKFSRFWNAWNDFGADTQNPDFCDFIKKQQDIYSAIRDISGKKVLVDSSKAAPRALVSRLIEPTDFIFLKRSPSDIMASWLMPKFDKGLGTYMEVRSPFRVTQDLFKISAFTLTKLRKYGVLNLDFGEFSRSPEKTIQKIADRFDLRISPNWQGKSEFIPSQYYHSLNGNPDRYKNDAIRIKPSTKRVTSTLTKSQKIQIAAFSSVCNLFS